MSEMKAMSRVESTDLWTLEEFCKYIKCGRTKGLDLCKEGHGFAYKIGGRWYVNRTHFTRWIETDCRV